MLQLFNIYDLIFPWMFGYGYDHREVGWPPPPDIPKRPYRPPSPLEKLAARPYLNLYMPIFRPRAWWNHMRAIDALLDDIGWIEIDS